MASVRPVERPRIRIFRRARAKARVLAPIPTEGLTSADVPTLKEKVRAILDVESARANFGFKENMLGEITEVAK